MKSKLKRIDTFFDSATRHKGHSYFLSGRVDLDYLASQEARAIVSGTEDYVVHIAWWSGGEDIGVNCDCLHALDGNFCKHIWATILAVFDSAETSFPGETRDMFWLDGSDTEAIDSNLESEVAEEQAVQPDRKQGKGSAGNRSLTSHNPAKKSLFGQVLDDLHAQQPSPRTVQTCSGQPEVLDVQFRFKEEKPVGSDLAELDERELSMLLSPLSQFGFRRQPTEVAKVNQRSQLLYALVFKAPRFGQELRLRLYLRKPGVELLQLIAPSRPIYGLEMSVEPEDARLLRLLRGFHSQNGSWNPDQGYFWISPDQLSMILPQLIGTGRFGLLPAPNRDPSHPSFKLIRQLDVGGWQTKISVQEDPSGAFWQVDGRISHTETGVPAGGDLMFAGSIVFLDDQALQLPDFERLLLEQLLQNPLRVPKRNTPQFRKFLYERLPLESLELPAALQLKEVSLEPQGALRLEKHHSFWRGEVGVLYEGNFVSMASDQRLVFDLFSERYSPRNISRELELHGEAIELAEQNLARITSGQHLLQVNSGNLLKVVNHLLGRGWDVSVAKQKIKHGSEFEIEITSGLDWFDLTGHMEFGDEVIPLPEILQRLEDSGFVRLANGALGLLPDGWEEKFAGILNLGQTQDDAIRFKPSQAFLLDAMLAEREFVSFDKAFAKVRQRIRQFDGIQPREVKSSFKGQLRPYQKQGHSWLHFLRDFGLGGCLADDMGLGKTVQVLALLDSWRQDPKRKRKLSGHRPSLLVVPKSLIFNWQAEAAKFAPKLRLLDFSGIGREAVRDQIPECDVVLMTYGTLRRDIEWLKEIEFDYAILDEAQAIKNATSQTAKATRLIQAQHRLALSGTPVENRLSDLWSIFEFLNPGMLGSSQAFAELGHEGEKESLEQLSKALRPLLLRRTKQQVLKDLPEKTENTLYCEMEGRQREIYDEVADFYRQSLLKKVRQDGIKKSKIHVLEALLRLRQIACHPALVQSAGDKKQTKAKSAKFEVLLDQLESVIAEGHKALVFSQFTSLLALLKPELEKRKIRFEYLDGGTRDRKRCVDRFNQSESIPLFLLSLKAGGHGLNLTSADYVFILDPWWNPAVEAQAIDRAHRIGQQRHVFGYRLIAKDTIEEKIMQLQQSKKRLAEAIISEDSSVIGALTVEDLELLLK